MSAKLLLAVAAAGCGRIHFDETTAGADAPLGTDAPPGSGPFAPPELVTGINSPVADDDPALTGDALEMIFDSARDTLPGDLFVTKRSDRSSPWSTPAVIAELATAADDEDGPMMSADGLMLTFASTRPPSMSADVALFVTTRPSRSAAWAAPQLIAELYAPGTDEHMPISADKLCAVFVSERAGVRALYSTRRASLAAPWETPRHATELDNGNPVSSVAMDPTCTIVYFAQDRAGGQGGLDLYTATRANPDAPFAAPQPLTELNTAADEQDPSISADLHVLAFVRGTDVDRDIYITTR